MRLKTCHMDCSISIVAAYKITRNFPYRYEINTEYFTISPTVLTCKKHSTFVTRGYYSFASKQYILLGNCRFLHIVDMSICVNYTIINYIYFRPSISAACIKILFSIYSCSISLRSFRSSASSAVKLSFSLNNSSV